MRHEAITLDLDVISRAIEGMIDLLDHCAIDPDLEPNGDELDHNGSEDDFVSHGWDGPGCPIADPDLAVDDRPCDEPYQDLEHDDGF